MPGFVYKLIDPRDGQCFYIGMTGNHSRRLHEHLSGKSRCSAPKVNELALAGLAPTMEIVAETSTVEEAHVIERRMLTEYRKARIPLCNNRYGRMPHHIHHAHGRGWDEKSKDMAADMFASGASLLVIAAALGRSTSGVRGILRRMGLIE
jgi:hypothetical protein